MESTKIIKLMLFSILMLSFSCDKDEYNVVPYVPVNLILSISSDLQHVGVGDPITITPLDTNIRGSEIRYYGLNAGSRLSSMIVHGNGLIIMQHSYDEYVAYDITCTYKANEDYVACKVEENDLLYVKCPKCGSRFNLFNYGSPEPGSKAAAPLKQYNAIKSGDLLRVYN